MSKKSPVRKEALEKVNGGYILDDRLYTWYKPAGVSEYLKWQQTSGSIKLINEKGDIVEEFQDMDKALAREKELGIKGGSIDADILCLIRRDAKRGR